MPRRRVSVLLSVLLLSGVLVLPWGSAVADPPTRPDCLPLGAGTTGFLLVGGQVPTPAQVQGTQGGLGPVAPPQVAATLPDQVVLKTNSETFSNEYVFAVRAGRLYVRPARRGVGQRGTTWRVLTVPSCLDGSVSAISADHRLLVVLGPDQQVYTHDMPGGDLSPERWTWRWGPYFWTGSGLTMFDDVRSFAASEFTADETFTDTSGRSHHAIGVATVYLLRGDRRRITYLDPWLPQDESREVCGPRRGTARLAALDASGSTLFVVTETGRLFTRLYDFDVSGANTVFGDFSWERPRPSSDVRWQLPGPRWVRQPAPRGALTDRIGIAKTGADAADRQLRVAGRDRAGRPGVWQKRISAQRWRFVRTGEPLRGRRLPLARRGPGGPPDDRRFAGSIGGRTSVVRDFNPECSPARVEVRIGRGAPLRLRLHTSDGMRQSMREGGLTEEPREYNGALEVPRRTWRTLDRAAPAVRRWVEENLDGRFTDAPLAMTTTRMRFLSQCWQLTLEGRPARPDQPALPPDFGIVVGRLTEMQDDGRQPSACLP